MHLVIKIPCYNEAQWIAKTLADLPEEIPGIDQITYLIIDDGSSDNSGKIALENGATYVVRHTNNLGLLRAFLTGLRTALALGADIIVSTDADNQYPGHYIPALVRPVLERSADLVMGSRQVGANPHFSPLKRLLQVIGTWLIGKLTRLELHCAASGFRAYSRYAALRVHVHSSF